MRKFGNVLWGIVFIVIGGIFALNALDITNINIFFSGWWTLFIIVPSFIGLFKETEKTGSIIFLVMGVLLLLGCQDIVTFDLIRKLIFPLILVLIGLSMIFKNAIGYSINQRIKELNKDGLEEVYATFSAQKLNYRDKEFKGLSTSAVFGGVELDLRGAIINSDQVITASAIFGGIDIKVPDNVKVEIKATPIFGGVDDKTISYSGENVPTIYLDAFCLFGGVEIK